MKVLRKKRKKEETKLLHYLIKIKKM